MHLEIFCCTKCRIFIGPSVKQTKQILWEILQVSESLLNAVQQWVVLDLYVDYYITLEKSVN